MLHFYGLGHLQSDRTFFWLAQVYIFDFSCTPQSSSDMIEENQMPEMQRLQIVSKDTKRGARAAAASVLALRPDAAPA